MSSNKASALMVLVSCVWGCGYVVTQFALDSNWTPFQIIAGRFLVGSIVLCAVFFKKLWLISKQDIIGGSITGFFLFCGFGFQTMGQLYSTPAISAFVTAASVVMVPFLDWGIYKKKPDIYVVAAALITFAGVALISAHGSMKLGVGILLTLIGTVFYAMQVCSLGHFAKKIDPVCLTIVMVIFTAVISSVLVILSALFNSNIPQPSFKGIGSIVFLGMFSTALCFLGQTVAQKYTSATKAAIILSTECVFGAIISVIFYKEILSIQAVIGCTMVFFSVILAETKFEFLRLNKGGTLDGR